MTHALFDPSVVVHIGATNKVESIGSAVWRNLSTGQARNCRRVIAAGKTATDWGRKTVVDAISEAAILPGPHLIVFTIPAKAIIEVWKEHEAFINENFGAIVIISGGFGEKGGNATLSMELMNLVHRFRGIVLGPNCIGVYCGERNFCTFFQTPETLDIQGSFDGERAISIVTQSGTLGLALLEEAAHLGVGVSSLLSIGNAVELDLLEAIQITKAQYPRNSIAVYAESLPVPLIGFAPRSLEGVVIHLAGYEHGGRLARDHTGSSPDRLAQNAYQAAGATFSEYSSLIPTARMMASDRAWGSGRPLYFITSGMGLAVRLGDLTTAGSDAYPKFVNDILGSADARTFARAIASLPETPHNLLLGFVPQNDILWIGGFAPLLIALDDWKQRHPNCVVGAMMDGGRSAKSLATMLAKEQIPVFRRPEDFVGTIWALSTARIFAGLVLNTPPAA